MIGLFQETGPCTVNIDSNSTTLNPYSWNQEVNMLYIDQPVQTGFSYDTLQNVTLDVFRGIYNPLDPSAEVPATNQSFAVGTIPSASPMQTVNSTENAARALWHFSQVFFQEFPDYKPMDNRVSIWTESYGGRYGPATAAYFQRQNEAIMNNQIDNPADRHIIHLDTLGIINGCIDSMVQTTSYADIAHNNTYGIQVYDDQRYQQAMAAWEGPGGCKELITTCRNKAKQLDPTNQGNNEEVNAACMEADQACSYVSPFLFCPFPPIPCVEPPTHLI